MAAVYILYSKKIDKYYIGSCLVLQERFQEHLQGKYEGSFTSSVNDWELYHFFEDL